MGASSLISYPALLAFHSARAVQHHEHGGRKSMGIGGLVSAPVSSKAKACACHGIQVERSPSLYAHEFDKGVVLPGVMLR